MTDYSAAVALRNAPPDQQLVQRVVERRPPVAMAGTGVPGLIELAPRDQKRWDTEWLLAGTGVQKVTVFTGTRFRVATGHPQSGVVKSKPCERNMPGNGRSMPTPHEMLIVGMQIEILGDLEGYGPSPRDLLALKQNCIVSYIQGEQRAWDMPLSEFAGTGLTGQSNAMGGGHHNHFGTPVGADYATFSHSFTNLSRDQFAVQLATSAEFDPDNHIRFKVVLVTRYAYGRR